MDGQRIPSPNLPPVQRTPNEPVARADVIMASGKPASVFFPESMEDGDLASLCGWMLQNLRVEARAEQRRARLAAPGRGPTS